MAKNMFDPSSCTGLEATLLDQECLVLHHVLYIVMKITCFSAGHPRTTGFQPVIKAAWPELKFVSCTLLATDLQN
jgi:hypothetical protein